MANIALMYFCQSKANIFGKLTDYLQSYENDNLAIKIRNNCEEVTKLTKYNTKLINAVFLKHALLEICIALIITTPFSSMGFLYSLKVFLITVAILTIVSFLFLRHSSNLFTKLSNTRFDKLNEDVKNADMGALKQNYDGTKNTIDMLTNVTSSVETPLIFRFINSFYFNGRFFEYCNFMKDFAFSINIFSRIQVLNNMFVDIKNRCMEIYKQSNNDESVFLKNVMDKFCTISFFKSVFENTVFCDNVKLNKYMVLWSSSNILNPFCDKNGEFDFNNVTSLLNSCNTSKERLEAYGYIGAMVVMIMIVEYGLNQIEIDDAICQ